MVKTAQLGKTDVSFLLLLFLFLFLFVFENCGGIFLSEGDDDENDDDEEDEGDDEDEPGLDYLQKENLEVGILHCVFFGIV